MTGNPSFLTSLYLAALKASEQMAIEVGDIDQAEEWRTIAGKSAKIQGEKLWNGEYFIQIRGEKPATDYETGCHSDQLLGQWWTDQLGLGNLYPDYKIKSATEAVLRYNFKSNLKEHEQGHRTFALPEEAGVTATTWPANNRPIYASGYSSEIWSTFEYTLGASLLKYNLVRDALTTFRADYDRYDGRYRTGYIGAWGNFGFSGNPFGDDECGQFYGRVLSQWSVLLAAQGFEYNGPKKRIGFDPKWKPENHESFYSVAKGWGLFTQKRMDNQQVNTVQLRYGTLGLKHMDLNIPATSIRNLGLELNGKPMNVTFKTDSRGSVQISFDNLILSENDLLEVTIDY